MDNGGQLAAEALALVHVVAGVRVLLRLALRAAPAVAVAQLSVIINCERASKLYVGLYYILRPHFDERDFPKTGKKSTPRGVLQVAVERAGEGLQSPKIGGRHVTLPLLTWPFEAGYEEVSHRSSVGKCASR